MRLPVKIQTLPPATFNAVCLSLVVHAAVIMSLGPLRTTMPQMGAFAPIEVSFTNEPAPHLVLKPRHVAATPTAQPALRDAVAPTTNTDAAMEEKQATANEEPLVEARYNVTSLNNPKPPYPLAARKRGIEGQVLLRARVQEDGYCSLVETKQSSGYTLLDSAAVETVKKWRFAPATLSGAPIVSWVEVPITFRLRDDLARN